MSLGQALQDVEEFMGRDFGPWPNLQALTFRNLLEANYRVNPDEPFEMRIVRTKRRVDA